METDSVGVSLKDTLEYSSTTSLPDSELNGDSTQDGSEKENNTKTELIKATESLSVSKCRCTPTHHLSFFMMLLLPKRLFKWKTLEYRIKENKDNLESILKLDHSKEELVMAGSFADGFNIPDAVVNSSPPRVVSYTKIDCMKVTKNVRVSLSSTKNEKCFIRVEIIGGQTNMAKLQLVNLDEIRQELQLKYEHVIFDQNDGIHYLSNSFGSIDTIASNSNRTNVTNDDSTMTSYPVFQISAFHCNEWPTQTMQWRERQRQNNWLSKHDIHSIMSLGFHIIPPEKEKTETKPCEWVISFCAAENYISKFVVTVDQRRCYMYLKLLYMLQLQDKCFLTSFHMKTAFMHACDSLEIEQWNQNPGACIIYMLDYMLKCIEGKTFPNYFLNIHNLIAIVSDQELHSALTSLKKLMSDLITPVLDFSDTTVFGMQCSYVPLRDITKTMLEDMETCTDHQQVHKSTTDIFAWTTFYIAHMLVKEEHPLKIREAVNYLIEIHPFLFHCDNNTPPLCSFIDGLGYQLDNVQQCIKFYEEAVDRAHEFPELLSLRGNLACIYHSASYTFSAEPEVESEVRRRADFLFGSIHKENPESASTIDYINFLCRQSKWKKAKEIVEKFISTVDDKTLRNGFGILEIECLDEDLKEEVYCHDQIEASSLSFAYYFLGKCLQALGSSLTEVEKNLQHFQEHCSELNCAKSFQLLGYSLKDAKRWLLAKQVFQKALELDCDYLSAEKNISLCDKHLNGSNVQEVIQ